MFTGIIQSIGKIVKIDNNNSAYKINTKLSLEDCKIGSSICCDGVCLTATSIMRADSNYVFDVNVGEETIKRSNLVNLKIGDKINIEKSLRMGDEIAGHFVYGHVDSTLKIKKIINFQNSWEFEFSFTALDGFKDFRKYIVEKGSVSINGISLTVANIFENSFNVSIIPHTFKTTTLSLLNEGDIVNIEFDSLARYICNKYGK
jgi:riboflavin synthase